MSDTPRAADKHVVTLRYTLTVDGELAESSRDREPFPYLHGANNIVPGLESALDGKAVGEKLSVTVEAAQGYGERNEEMRMAVPQANFPPEFKPELGSSFVGQTESGQQLQGFIVEVPDDEMVVVDFKHPLAGRTLNFDVEILAIRAASEEELAQGMPARSDAETDSGCGDADCEKPDCCD